MFSGANGVAWGWSSAQSNGTLRAYGTVDNNFAVTLQNQAVGIAQWTSLFTPTGLPGSYLFTLTLSDTLSGGLHFGGLLFQTFAYLDGFGDLGSLIIHDNLGIGPPAGAKTMSLVYSGQAPVLIGATLAVLANAQEIGRAHV